MNNKSSLFACKIAFQIPGHYGRDGIYGRKYDDKMIDKLMDLFEGCEFESENICSPALLIVNFYLVPTQRQIKEYIAKINKVLKKYEDYLRKDL